MSGGTRVPLRSAAVARPKTNEPIRNDRCANWRCDASPRVEAVDLDERGAGRCPACGARIQWTGAAWWIPGVGA